MLLFEFNNHFYVKRKLHEKEFKSKALLYNANIKSKLNANNNPANHP